MKEREEEFVAEVRRLEHVEEKLKSEIANDLRVKALLKEVSRIQWLLEQQLRGGPETPVIRPDWERLCFSCRKEVHVGG